MTPPRAWWRRLRAGLSGRARVPMIYARDYAFSLPGSPLDPLRAEKVLASLHAQGLLPRGSFRASLPASMRQLMRAHSGDYLERLEAAETAQDVVGLPLDESLQARAVAAQRAMAGGTLAAARLALRRHGVAVNLGGGLHHARPERGAGYCFLNDLAIALAQLRRDGFRGRALIVDLDLHDGDGTREFFRHDASVFTYSLHNRPWDEIDAVANVGLALGSGVEDAELLAVLEETLPAVIRSHRPELVFYLAGTDPAGDDPLGDWKLTAAGLLQRDRRVFELAEGLATVMLLAGGYGPETWRYSARTLSRIRGGRVLEPLSTDAALLRRYRAVARFVPRYELTREPATGDDDGWGLTEEDLGAAGLITRPQRFLDFYTQHGLELVLERTGFLNRIRDRGYPHPSLEVDLEGSTGHTLRIWGEPDRRHLVVEVRLRRDHRIVPGRAVLFIEWLLLQDPRASVDRDLLPGQRYPSLGLFQDALALLAVAAERVGLDGVVALPSHYHLAALSYGEFHFLSPEAAGTFEAIRTAGTGLGLLEIDRALAEGRARDAVTGETVTWEVSPMVLPVHGALHDHLTGPAYRQALERSRDARALTILAPTRP